MDIQTDNKHVFLTSLALACYVAAMVVAHIVFNKQNNEHLAYSASIATLPSRFHDSMSLDEFTKLSEVLKQLERGGRLSLLNPDIDALPLSVFLGKDRVDLGAIESLLDQKLIGPAKAKVELLSTKVQRAQRRQSRILNYLPWPAIIGVISLTFMVFLTWFAQRTRLTDEIAAASELMIQPLESKRSNDPDGVKISKSVLVRTAFNPNAPKEPQLSFTERLHAVVKEEVQFTGHRAALVLDGFDQHRLASHIESELEMIVEQLVRNSVEHGGRPAEQRIMAGKKDFLKIEVSLSESASDYILSVRDDGEGLDEALIIARALELSLVNAESVAKFPAGQALKFIFLKGFYSPIKPLGVSENDMALNELRSLIREQGGTISLQNLTGRFCQFSVRLPKMIA